ncbi:MAG: TAXI family TRAP transporter solute-binding subunit [Betaproteobacteria bacterium]|nr:MAG: TAXI family TRAP transporter solute-binding subunit [Betaproteobacteria bacterium]
MERAASNGTRIVFRAAAIVLVWPCVAQAQTMLQMPTGGVTGSYYMSGAPLSKCINERSKLIRVTPNTSGGGVENLRRVESGTAQLGMVQVDLMYSGWRGEKPFDKPMRNWRVLGVVTPILANHVLVLASQNVKTASDLKGKTFAIGAPGSGAAVQMKMFLDHTGLSKTINARMLPHQDYPTMLLDGKIDAINRANSVPAAVVEEIAAQKAIALVDFSKELEQSKYLEKHPYISKLVVKGGTYKGESRDITLFGTAGFLVAHKDVPEAVAYEFTKLAYSEECVKQVNTAFAGANLSRKAPLEGNIGPVHPGAAKYWKESGVSIPAPLLK